jgi:hypothetical protein
MNDNDDYPPYPKQGEPIPDGLAVRGYWVCEGKSFLFHETADIKGLWGIANENGYEADGFGIGSTAANLGISELELIAVNNRRELRISMSGVTPNLGIDSAVNVTIQTPDHGFTVVMNRIAPKGHA